MGENSVQPSKSSERLAKRLQNQIDSKTCLTCNEIFATKLTMKEYDESIHKNIKYLCVYCNTAITTKKSTRYHIGRFLKDKHISKDKDLVPVVQERAKKKEYICTWCNRVCDGPSKLKTHRMTPTRE